MKNKSIDINQRIPLQTLYVALESFLNGSYSNEYILEQLRLEFDGENRLKKALRIVNKIIQRNPLNEFILANKAELKNAIKKKSDRDVILIALLNSAFPFSFDVLKTFGKFFAVQEIINTETIKKPVSNIYGGNRATENGLYSVIPMFIEAGFFTRPRAGVYERKDKIIITSKVTTQIYIESYKSNSTLEGIQDYQLREPYFLFINN
ncbi:MAG: hypothetical protein APF83_08780 [Lutibacter sp. BRH_c52]|nr:MAG: hypothetical protein APF83_08780 [Lutibacter sp. BRH_c52]